MPEEVADLLERARFGQVVHVVPAVGEHPAIAVEIADRRRRGDDVLESSLGFFRGCHELILSCNRTNSQCKRLMRPMRPAAWEAWELPAAA